MFSKLLMQNAKATETYPIRCLKVRWVPCAHSKAWHIGTSWPAELHTELEVFVYAMIHRTWELCAIITVTTHTHTQDNNNWYNTKVHASVHVTININLKQTVTHTFVCRANSSATYPTATLLRVRVFLDVSNVNWPPISQPRWLSQIHKIFHFASKTNII